MLQKAPIFIFISISGKIFLQTFQSGANLIYFSIINKVSIGASRSIKRSNIKHHIYRDIIGIGEQSRVHYNPVDAFMNTLYSLITMDIGMA